MGFLPADEPSLCCSVCTWWRRGDKKGGRRRAWRSVRREGRGRCDTRWTCSAHLLCPLAATQLGGGALYTGVRGRTPTDYLTRRRKEGARPAAGGAKNTNWRRLDGWRDILRAGALRMTHLQRSKPSRLFALALLIRLYPLSAARISARATGGARDARQRRRRRRSAQRAWRSKTLPAANGACPLLRATPPLGSLFGVWKEREGIAKARLLQAGRALHSHLRRLQLCLLVNDGRARSFAISFGRKLARRRWDVLISHICRVACASTISITCGRRRQRLLHLLHVLLVSFMAA